MISLFDSRCLIALKGSEVPSSDQESYMSVTTHMLEFNSNGQSPGLEIYCFFI